MPVKPQENVLPIEGSGRVLAHDDRRIGSILAEEGKLGAEDIERVMELQQSKGMRFGEAAQRLGLITEDDLRCAVAKQYDLPHLLPGNESISSELVVAYEPFHPRAEELRALRTISEEHTSELQSPCNLVCRLLLEKKKHISC